jgi:hypothetical protein
VENQREPRGFSTLCEANATWRGRDRVTPAIGAGDGTRAICPRSIPDADINAHPRPSSRQDRARAATHDPIALLDRDLTHPDRLGRRLPLFKTQVCEKEPLYTTTLPTDHEAKVR